MQEQQHPAMQKKDILKFTQAMISQFKFGNTNIEQLPLLSENYDLAFPEAPASPVEGKPEEMAEELFDKYSEYIDDTLDALSMVAGRSIVTREQFKKCIIEIFAKPSPVIEIGEQPKPEDMPQTENPLASYWFEKARLCLVDRNDFRAQLLRANERIEKLSKASHPAPAPIVGERDGIEEERVKSGNKLLDMVDELLTNPAPKDQALPEEIKQWVGDFAECDADDDATLWRNGAIAMYHKMQEQISQVTGNAVAFSRLSVERTNELSQAREQLTSARKLITDLRHGNYVLDVDDICERWLRENPENPAL